MDLIDRQAAIDEGYAVIVDDAVYDVVQVETLEGLPSVDAVEVVRCKNCKWYKTNYSWNGKEHKVCVIEPYEPVRKGDDFCSRGEQKDG